MGPTNNPELYQAVARPSEAHLAAEYERRNLVAPTLTELGQLFADKDNTPRQVAEPTLFTRLYALSMVQRGRMGIYGFNPLGAFNYDNRVEAKAAPYHDEYTAESGNLVRTRAIELLLPEQGVDQNIRIFGLNLYEATSIEDVIAEDPRTSTTSSGLVVTDRRGRATGVNRTPIFGEIAVFAVHNTLSGDAKYYTVRLLSPEQYQVAVHTDGVEFDNDKQANAYLPDKQQVVVEQLTGPLQIQTNSEFAAAIDKLKNSTDTSKLLTEEEAVAVQTVLSQSRDY